jgi:hypothetical protein
MTIVRGDYKLIKDIDTQRIFLFNLKKDISESNNLADEEAELAKRMYDDMIAYFKRFGWDESKITSQSKLKGKKDEKKNDKSSRIH